MYVIGFFFSKLSAFLLFLSIIESCFSSSNFPILSLNEPHVLSLHCTDSLTFKISANLSFTIGTFSITAKIIDSQLAPAILLISNENCENENMIYLDKSPSQKALNSEGSIVVTFNLNTSIDQCFKITSFPDTECIPTNYSVLATFAPIATVFKLNKFSNFELDQDSEKEFAFDLTDRAVEMVLISIKTAQDNLILSSEKDDFELRDFEGLCIKTSLPRSWLCSLKNTKAIFKFSLYNIGPHRFHQIIISEMSPKQVEPNIDGMMLSSVPGLGTFFTVTLPLAGILKIQASSEDHKPLPIITSISLPNLITTVSNKNIRLLSVDSQMRSEEFTLITNYQSNLQWFYFVPEKDSRNFFISSCFQKLAPAEIGIPSLFFIDPKVFEYQLVKVKLDKARFHEKYQVTLFSQSNCSISLYYNRYSFGLDCISGQNQSSICNGGILVSSPNTDELSLEFEAEPLDSTIYLIIKVSKQEFYTLEVAKLNSEGILRRALSIVLLVYFVISFFWYLYKLHRKREACNSNENSIQPEYLERGIDPPSLLQSDLEINMFQSNIAVSDNRIRRQAELQPNLIIIEKYKRKENLKLMVSFENKRVDLESYPVKQKLVENEDEERCDICFEKRKTVTFKPCTHACACIFCAIIIAQTSSSCPLSRAEKTEIKLPDNQAIEIENRKENEEINQEE